MLWLSLGENCLADDVLKRHGRKSFSTPYSSARSNIDYALQLEREGYGQLLDSARLRECDAWGKRVIRSSSAVACAPVFHADHSQGFELTHHDPIASEKDRQSLQRKIDRLRDVRGEQDTVFLYHHRRNGRSSLDYVRSRLAAFAELYQSVRASCHIVLFHQEIVATAAARQVRFEGATGGVLEFTVHSVKHWAGNDSDLFWARGDDDLFVALFGRVDRMIR